MGNIPSKYYVFKLLGIIILGIALNSSVRAQPNDISVFVTIVDSTIIQKPSVYREINKIFKGTTGDSIKMNYLLKKSMIF